MGKVCAVTAQFIFCVTLPYMCQQFAMGSSYWLTDDGVNKGLGHEVWADGSVHTQDLDPDVSTMQSVAFIYLSETWMNFLVLVCFHRKTFLRLDLTMLHRFIRLWFTINIVLYLPMSCFILTSCILFIIKHPMELIGHGFYLSLSACLAMWLSIFVFICDQLCKKKSENSVYHSFLTLKKEYDICNVVCSNPNRDMQQVPTRDDL